MVAGTRVLTADLEWVNVEELDLDDEVVSFDNPDDREKNKQLTLNTNKITACWKYKENAVKVVTDKGEITVGETHPFLSKHHGWRDASNFKQGQEIRYLVEPNGYEKNDQYWNGYACGAFAGDGSVCKNDTTQVASLRCQDREIVDSILENSPVSNGWGMKYKGTNSDGLHEIRTTISEEVDRVDSYLPVFEQWSENKDYMRGWLAGLFDTDGSFDGNVVRFNQYDGEVKDYAEEFLSELGYSPVREEKAIRVSEGYGGKFEILTEIRPQVSRKVRKYEGRAWKGQATVQSVEGIGEKTFYDVTVENDHTLIAEGFCSHQCYEEEDRAVNGNDVTDNYDMDAIMEELENFKERYPNEIPGLHGGEPLLLRDEDIETIFEWVYNNYEQVRNGEKYTHIQTNATLLRDKHIEMFDKYNVNVGISCDGPPELNEHRKAAMREEATDRLSGLTYENIFKLGETSVPVGVIVVVHEGNAGTDERLETLFEWMDKLNQNGISGHFNEMLPYEEINQELALSGERLKEVYLKTWEWMKGEPYRTWNPMRDFQDNLLGNSLTDCRVAECDPFDAGAAKIIDGEGETSGCGKTWAAVGDGTPFLQGPSNNSEYNDDQDRERILKDLPGAPETEGPDLGGCKGCRYWSVCHGGCPSAGIDEDHRNRTRWCESKYYLYKRIEEDMRTMFPNIQLVTDLPWDAETHQYASNGVLDIGQFDAMNSQGDGKKKSVYGGFERHKDFPHDMIPQDAMPERTQESIIDEFKQKHGEENVTVDVQGDEVITHADSDMGGQ
jgi:uncharacterized protein